MGAYSRISVAATATLVLGVAAISGCAPSDNSPNAGISSPTLSMTSPAATTTKRIYNAQDNLVAALEFLNYLYQRDAPIPRDDSELAYHRAAEICSSLDHGKSVEELQRSWTNMLTADGAMIYIRGAIEHVCPEHAGKLAAP